jgi:predicted O-methyltransferase YrrM
MAAATKSQRILEVGCGLGYSALWLASGCGADGAVSTVERDPVHAALAQEHFVDAKLDSKINILNGEACRILQHLSGPYDLIYVDSDVVEYASYLNDFSRLISAHGTLISSNLFFGQYDLASSGYVTGDAYREILLSDGNWFTVLLPNGTAVSVRRSPNQSKAHPNTTQAQTASLPYIHHSKA